MIAIGMGNTRSTNSDNNNVVATPIEILQENHYYPFGMPMEGPWCNNGTADDTKYLYNGKELHDDLGLGWYGYGARYYDASIAKFTGVDPISNNFPHVSTYNYAENEPIANIDLWGLQRYYAADGKFINKVGNDNTIKIFNAGQSGDSKPLHLADVNAQKAVIKYIYNNDMKPKYKAIYIYLGINSDSELAANYGSSDLKFNVDKNREGEYLLDNYFNLTNSMFHEQLHDRSEFKGGDLKANEHFQIGKLQSEHISFKKTTTNFKSFFKETMRKYIGQQKEALDKIKDKKSSEYKTANENLQTNLNYYNRVYGSN